MKVGRSIQYAGVLDIPERTVGDWAIKHDHRPADWVFSTGNLRTLMYGQPSNKVRFAEATRWHALTENGSVWMTNLPIEQRQTDELVRGASGHVLVGGLGLGYAALALACRSRVRSVTVVERAPEVIELTQDAMLKSAGRHAAKLKVVNADLFHFLKESATGGFDFGLYDIWTGDGEHTFHHTVVPLRKLSQGKVKRVVCWNEDIMRGQLMMGLNMRARMLQMPKGPEPGFAPTLDWLCEPHRNIYTDWACPFWQWVRDRIGEQNIPEHYERLTHAVRVYVESYGRPDRDFDFGELL